MNKEKKKKILIADDNPEIIELMELLLTENNYEIISVSNGIDAIVKTDETIDLIILDVMMPIKNGYDACEKIRKKTTAPILFLTAKDQEMDKEIAFNLGADDFISKPFSYVEFLARVNALLRRYYVYKGKDNQLENIIKYKNIIVDTKMKCAIKDDTVIKLTSTEFNILCLFLRNPKKVYSSEELFEEIWKDKYYYNANNTIMVHILKLRKKIEDDYKNPNIIKTAWGKGYYID